MVGDTGLGHQLKLLHNFPVDPASLAAIRSAHIAASLRLSRPYIHEK